MQYVDLSSILLEGYLPKGEPVRSKSGEKEFVTVSYKGIHSNEYVIFEIKNDQYDGTAELYDEGVLKMRWSMHNGDREGSFVLYEDGVASREGRWDDLNDDTEVMTWIEDSEDGLRMAITHNNQLVYRGGFNDTYQRDGFGVEFSDGQPTQTGEFVDGTLVHIYQRVVNSSKMIEFGGRGNENNLSIPSRRPIYIGGFSYNAERNRCFRNGRGNQLDDSTGVCVAITEWIDGVEDPSCRQEVIQRLHENRGSVPQREETPLPREMVSDPLTAEEVNISGNSWNTADLSELVFSDLPRLKRLCVADGSFTQVRRFIVRDLQQLEFVEIGRNSLSFAFSGYPQRRDDGVFHIANCAKLRHVAIGAKSCSDYSSLVLSHVDALTELLIGDYGFHHSSEFRLQRERAMSVCRRAAEAEDCGSGGICAGGGAQCVAERCVSSGRFI